MAWFRNRNKLQWLHGEAYCSIRNEQGEFLEQPPRLMGPRCDSKRCRQVRSSHLVSEEDRQRSFTSFWSSMDWDQRKIYVVGLADMVDVKRKRSESNRRQHSVKYHLRKGETKFQVCKNMFLSILCLGEWTFQNWLKTAEDGMISASQKVFEWYPEVTFALFSCELIEDVLGATLPITGWCVVVYKVFKEKQSENVASRQILPTNLRERTSLFLCRRKISAHSKLEIYQKLHIKNIWIEKKKLSSRKKQTRRKQKMVNVMP